LGSSVQASTQPIIIKKYANRRLYNTETSTYITQADLALLIRLGREVEVVDAKTGQDLTRQTLAQIILEEEAKGASVLPVNFMRQLIGFYDNSMQSILPHYLDMVMDVFKQNQQRMKDETNRTLGSFSPFVQIEAMQTMQRQQLEQMQHVMGMFNPFLRNAQKPENPTTDAEKAARIAALEAELAKLKSK
jgi:polyhydroxyalkanoate synthesis repressor PhaR